MAQTGYTPILIYSSSTAAAAPVAGSLTNSTLGSELAINITDGKLFYKDNANAIQVIGWKVVPTTAGGTGLTSYAQGDLLYYNSGTTLTALAKNTTATRYLSNTGTNNNPAWAQVDLSNGVTGTLPVGNGGTGLASYTANRILYASGTTTIATSAGLTFDGTNFATTGTASATKFIPTGGTATGNGMYLPSANTLSFSTNGSQAATIDSSRRFMVGYSSNNNGELFGVLGLSQFGSAGNVAITSTYANAISIKGEGSSGTTCSSIHFGDNASGASRQWAIANAPSTLARLDFVISSAVNTNPLASGTTILSLTSGGLVSVPTYSTTVGATNRDLFVDNAGVIGYVSSLQASKTNIQDLVDTSWLYQLNPVSFNYLKKDENGNYTDEIDGNIQYGMIAEDVEQIRPDLCFYDEINGKQELRGIQYSKLVPVMLKALQQQQKTIDELNIKIEKLQNTAN
jgi:hypothetical protein